MGQSGELRGRRDNMLDTGGKNEGKERRDTLFLNLNDRWDNLGTGGT